MLRRYMFTYMYLCLLQENNTCITLHVTCWDVTCITLHVTCWDITCYMLRRYMYYITCYMLRRYMYYIHVRLSVTGRHYMYNITCHMLRCYMYTLHVTCWDITYYMLRCYIITYIYLCLLQGENPIYKQATSTFVNPTYRKWGSHPREDPNQDPDSDQIKGVSHAKQTNKQSNKQQKQTDLNHKIIPAEGRKPDFLKEILIFWQSCWLSRYMKIRWMTKYITLHLEVVY